MPISLDDAFAGAIGREFGAGPSMADQFDRLGRALERRRDPLTRIGLDTFEAIRDMAGQLRKPPWYVLAVRVENLGFLELMAGGSYVFLILIYLKLDQIFGRLWSLRFELQTVNAHLDVLSARLGAVIQQLGPLASLDVQFRAALAKLDVVIALLHAIFAVLARGLTMLVDLTIRQVHDVSIDLGPIDLGQLLIDLAALAALLGAVAVAGGPAALALALFAAAAALAAGALALVAGALQLMPDDAVEMIKWIAGLGAAILGFLIVAAALGFTGKGLVGMIVGVVGALLLLFGIAGALALMPDDIDAIVPPLLKLIGALGALAVALALIKPDRIWQVVGGLVALGVFLLLTAAAFRIFDETAVQAMQAMPQFLNGLQALADYIKDLEPDAMRQIALGLAGIVAFVFLLGLALRVFPEDAAPALQAMAQVFEQMTLIADKIVELATGGHMATVAQGLAGVLVFVFLLGLALMVFGEESIQAAMAIAQLVGALTGLSLALVLLSGADLWTLVAIFAGLAGVLLAVGIAAAVGGPNLQGLASALTALSTLIDTVAKNARSLVSALNSIPGSISLPSIPGIGSLPGFADGGPVTATGPYVLHAGEHVLNPAETRAMHAGRGPAASGPSISVGAVNVTISAQSVDEGAAPALGDEIVRRIGERLAELGREDAFAQGVRSETG